LIKIDVAKEIAAYTITAMSSGLEVIGSFPVFPLCRLKYGKKTAASIKSPGSLQGSNSFQGA
jgi:hypothetical protein